MKTVKMYKVQAQCKWNVEGKYLTIILCNLAGNHWPVTSKSD